MLSDAPIGAMIPATDVGRAKRFYSETLGLKISAEMGEEGVLFESAGGTSFFVYQTPSGGQAAHTLASWQVADLAAEMADLRGRGVSFEEYDMPGIKTVDGLADMGAVRGAWFKDSEGNILGVMEQTA
jgi:predicted enzyme related to lactoylglutathione lyase